MPIKKAILTGGGRATRLRPITTTINKHLIPLAGKPMIFHAIEKAVEAGVEEIFINTNPGEDQLQKEVGNGSRWGIKIVFFEQPGGPQGIAHVVKCAEKFIGEDPFMFYLSDNIILGSIKPLFERFENENLDCLLALSKVPDPERFGVPEFNAEGKLVDIYEKPAQPPSDFAVTGIYLYNKSFFVAYDQIEKSARGEYEISSIHSHYLKNGYNVGYQEITGWWKDTGKPTDLILANQLLIEEIPRQDFVLECSCLADTHQIGKVAIGKNTVIGKNVRLTGPMIIGENCYLENCVIGPYTTIATGSIIKNARVENSLIFDNCRLESDIEIKDSIIGKNTTIIPHQQGKFERLILGDNTLIEM